MSAHCLVLTDRELAQLQLALEFGDISQDHDAYLFLVAKVNELIEKAKRS